MSLELWEYRWPKWNNPTCNCIIITLILQVSHPENIEMLLSCIHSGNKFLNSKGKCLEILVSGKIKTQTTPKIYLLVEESPLYRGKSMSFKPNQHWNSVALHIFGLSVMIDQNHLILLSPWWVFLLWWFT